MTQDFSGDFGVFVYHDGDYFAVSNSFHVLVDHVKRHHPLTINRDYANQLLATWIVSLADEETAVEEIQRLPSDATLHVFLDGSGTHLERSESRCNSVGLDTKEGMALLDTWYAKWVHITRGILAETNLARIDLSGGLDSRLTFLFALRSGVNLNRVMVRSLNDGLHTHAEDFRIASSIAERYGFTLNDRHGISIDTIPFSREDVVNLTYYTKMLFQQEPTFPMRRNVRRRFIFGGYGGETVRPYWDMPTKEFYEHE